MRALVTSLRGEMRGEHQDLQGRYSKLEAELKATKVPANLPSGQDCFIYIYVYVCVCINESIYIYAHTYIHICIYIYMNI